MKQIGKPPPVCTSARRLISPFIGQQAQIGRQTILEQTKNAADSPVEEELREFFAGS